MTIKYYIDESSEIRAIEEGQEGLVQPSWKLVEDLQKELKKRGPKPNLRDITTKRDFLLSQTDWYVTRFIETGKDIPENVKKYREELRNLSEQKGYPTKVKWPKL